MRESPIKIITAIAPLVPKLNALVYHVYYIYHALSIFPMLTICQPTAAREPGVWMPGFKKTAVARR